MKKLSVSPLYIFLCVHVFVWTLLPYFCRRTIPMDSLEAIVWGGFWEFGTNKHPPLSGFLIYPFYELLAESPLAVYLLSQICIVLGFIYIYKLAKCFISRQKAMLATMMMEGVVYYTITSAEYNVNIVSLALWPMNVYYFYQSLTQNKIKDWGLFGIVSALNILNKYVSGILFVPMLLYVLFTKKGRKVFGSFGAYFAVFLAVLLCLPHLCWLWQYDFYTFSYFVGRTGGETSELFVRYPFLKHIFYPIKFAGGLLLAGSGAIFLYVLAFYNAKKEPASVSNRYVKDKDFVFIMGLGPAVFCMLISLISGVYLKSMWGTPCLYMLTVILFTSFPRLVVKPARAIVNVYVIMGIMAIIAAGIYLGTSSHKVWLDGKGFAADMQDVWHKQFNERPFAYVGGDIWLASLVSLYAEDRPVAVAVSPENNPWLFTEDIFAKGALVLIFYPDECKNFSDSAEEPQKFSLKSTNYFGKTKERDIWICFLKGKTSIGREK